MKSAESGSELYYDLGIYGLDYHEVLVWAHDHFGVDFSEMNLNEYCPGEPGCVPMELLWPLFKVKNYRSFTVTDLADAIVQGRYQRP